MGQSPCGPTLFCLRWIYQLKLFPHDLKPGCIISAATDSIPVRTPERNSVRQCYR